jgi:quinol monooxygenase YgiN
MVRFTLAIVSAPGSVAMAAAAIRQLMFQVRRERGCLSAWASADLLDPCRQYYVEEWMTEDDFVARLRSAQFQGLITLMEAAAEPPQVSVQTVSRSYGFEYIETAIDGGQYQ